MNLPEIVFIPTYSRAYCPEGYVIDEDGFLARPEYKNVPEYLKRDYLEDVNIINGHGSVHPGRLLFLSVKKAVFIHAYDYHVAITSGGCRIADCVYLHNLKTAIYNAYNGGIKNGGLFDGIRDFFRSAARDVRISLAEKLFIKLSEMEGEHLNYPTIQPSSLELFLENKQEPVKYDKEASKEMLDCVSCEYRQRGATGDCSTCPLNEDAGKEVKNNPSTCEEKPKKNPEKRKRRKKNKIDDRT